MTTLLGQCDLPVRQRMVGHWLRVDEGLGTRIAAAIRVDLDDARKAVEEVDRCWAERGRPNAGALPAASRSATTAARASQTDAPPASSGWEVRRPEQQRRTAR